MARFKSGLDVDQLLLLPPSLREWLPEDHLAWFVMDSVEALDIDELLDKYRVCGKGELAYNPRMMLRVLIYAYATGVFSSRKIATQLRENVAFRVLAGNQMPGHRSIRRFRMQHIAQFGQLFAQVVKMAAESGLAKIGTLAIDGSKLKANASKRKAMSYSRMKDEEARLEREIATILKVAQDQDAEEDVDLGPDFRGDELPEELRRRETRLQHIREAKARLEKRKAEEAKAAEEAKNGDVEQDREQPVRQPRAQKQPKGEPKPKDQENFTDPDSRIMKSSNGFEQSYNVQIAVDAESRLIVGNLVGNCAADARQLIPTIEAAMANTGLAANCVLADAGYRSEKNLEVLEQSGIDAYVALGRENKTARKASADHAAATRRMERKLRTERGRQRYRRRKHIAEPPFGWIKSVLGFRSFSLRGLAKVAGEFNLVALALNLRRMRGMKMA